jgi:hypothetical protein
MADLLLTKIFLRYDRRQGIRFGNSNDRS